MPIELSSRMSFQANVGETRAAIIRYPAGYRQAEHAHPLASITLLWRGEIDERAGGRLGRGSSMSVVTKPAGVAHRDDVGRNGADTFQLVLSHRLEAEVAEHTRDGWVWRWGRAEPIAVAMTSFLMALRTDAGARALEGSLYDVLGAVQRRTPERAGPVPAWLRRSREALRASLVDPPSVRSLADEAGLHPVSLARIHRAYFGESLTDALRSFRVCEAMRLLSETEMSLTNVAFSTGFSDQSHFTRVFRAATGFTPGNARHVLAS